MRIRSNQTCPRRILFQKSASLHEPGQAFWCLCLALRVSDPTRRLSVACFPRQRQGIAAQESIEHLGKSFLAMYVFQG